MTPLDFVRENFHWTTPELARELSKSERHIRRLRQKVREQGTEVSADTLTITGGKDKIEFSGLQSPNPLSPGSTGAFQKVFELAGADPEKFELVADTFKFSTWQQSKAGDDGNRDLVQLYSYKGTFRAKNDRLVSFEDVLPLIKEDARVEPPHANSDNTTFVVALSDLQLGKFDERGGTPETLRRVREVLHGIEEYLKQREKTYTTIVLYDVGDIIEGFANTTQQQQTNDLSLTDQLRTAQAVVIEAIKMLAAYTPNLVYVSVPSNHCQVRTSVGTKNRSNSPDDDYGLLVQDTIQQAFEAIGSFQGVRFVRPSKWQEAVAVTVADGTVLGCVHGHQFSSSAKSGEWLAEAALARRAGMETVDVLVHGHHHNFSLGVAGHGQQLIGCPTLDNGSAWFSNNKGSSTPPAVLTFELADKRSKDWKLWEA